MSTLSSNESRLGSSLLHYLKFSLKNRKAISRDANAPLSILECVSAWAAENPNAPAVTNGAETLSYSDLEAQSNALARHLESLGAGSDTLVALMLDRSPELAIAALAAWKVGAAYLPLDP